MSLEGWWKLLEESGWLAEVPRAESDRIKDALQDYADNELFAFSALATSGFDTECIENDGDYAKWVISSYAEASLGAFTPEAVVDTIDWPGGTASISFRVGEREFSRTFQQDSDYIADGVHDFMNEVMEALGERRRFQELPTDDQTQGIVCVTPETYERACQLGVIPPQEALVEGAEDE